LSKRKGRAAGRHEPNLPKVSLETLQACLMKVMVSRGVVFDKKSRKSYADRYWDLYTDLLMLAPALAVATDLPVSIYGVGSFRVKRAVNGRKRLRIRGSSSISKFLDHYVSGEYSDDAFWYVFQQLIGSGKSNDTSLMEVKCGYIPDW